MQRHFPDFVTPSRQGLRTFALQKANQLFAKFSAKVGRVADTGCRYENTQFNRLGTGIGHLQVHKLPPGCVVFAANSTAFARMRSIGAL